MQRRFFSLTNWLPRAAALALLTALALTGQATLAQAPTPTSQAARAAQTPTAPRTPALQRTPTPAAGQAAKPTAKDACGNAYQPVVAKAQWQYEIKNPPKDAPLKLGSRYTDTLSQVSGSTATMERVYAKPSDAEKETEQWECRNGAIVAAPAAGQKFPLEPGVFFNITSVKSEGVSVPANPKPGDTWSQTVRIMGTIQVGNQSLNAELQFKTACKAARMETVTVPAGRFDALRVDCTRETRGKASQGGTSQEFPPSTEETKSWLAAGIGLVKSTSPATGEANLLKYGLP